MKLDIMGNPIKPRPKCANCGKDEGNHNAVTHECPAGPKHRTMGYTYYGPGKFLLKAQRDNNKGDK